MKQVKPCPFECNANDCKDCGAYTYSHHTQTKEEWFCQLNTVEKAEIIAQLSSYGGNMKAILEWLKQPHKDE